MQSPIVILGYLFMTIKCLRQLPNKLEAVKISAKVVIISETGAEFCHSDIIF